MEHFSVSTYTGSYGDLKTIHFYDSPCTVELKVIEGSSL